VFKSLTVAIANLIVAMLPAQSNLASAALLVAIKVMITKDKRFFNIFGKLEFKKY
jgi:hypothetical protein